MFWQYRRVGIHRAVGSDALAVANYLPHRARSDKVPPRLRTTHSGLTPRPPDTPFRLTFFRFCIGVGDDDTACFPLSLDVSRLTPTTTVLPIVARFQQHFSDGVFADLWQAILGLT